MASSLLLDDVSSSSFVADKASLGPFSWLRSSAADASGLSPATFCQTMRARGVVNRTRTTRRFGKGSSSIRSISPWLPLPVRIPCITAAVVRRRPLSPAVPDAASAAAALAASHCHSCRRQQTVGNLLHFQQRLLYRGTTNIELTRLLLLPHAAVSVV